MQNGSWMMAFVKVNPHFLFVRCKEKSHINLTVSAVPFSPSNRKTLKVTNEFPRSFTLGILIKTSELTPVLIKSGTLH
jgi:hypothetical protein